MKIAECRMARHQITLVIGFIILFSSILVCSGDERRRPTRKSHSDKETLLLWLNEVQRDGFELLFASRRQGFYHAVFRTKDGIAFCHHNKTRQHDDDIAFFQILDMNNKGLEESEKPEILTRELQIEDNIAKSTVIVDDGMRLRFRKELPDKIRVVHKVGANDGGKKTVLDQWIEIP